MPSVHDLIVRISDLDRRCNELKRELRACQQERNKAQASIWVIQEYAPHVIPEGYIAPSASPNSTITQNIIHVVTRAGRQGMGFAEIRDEIADIMGEAKNETILVCLSRHGRKGYLVRHNKRWFAPEFSPNLSGMDAI